MEVAGYFNGLLTWKAREVGVTTPMNDRMVVLYKCLKRGEIEQGTTNLSLFSASLPR